jgi:hypothetical protein
MHKIPFSKAFSKILMLTLLISGTAWFSFFYFKYVKGKHASDPAYKIVAIVQTTPNREPLKTSYLAELLDLSIDRPQNLYKFNAKETRKTLLATPFIKEAQVKKIRPGTVHIYYKLREPIAFLVDFENTLIDAMGVPFPYKPFFTPKRLPELYLGLNEEKEIAEEAVWGKEISGEKIDLALAILAELDQLAIGEVVKGVDVSQAYASSCGRREVVVALEECVKREEVLYFVPKFLRLETDSYRDGLKRYEQLKSHVKRDLPTTSDSRVQLPAMTIDLRLPQLAFFDQ